VNRVSLMGMPLDPLTTAQTLEHIAGELSHGRGGWVITPNVELARQFQISPEVRALYERGDLILADGMPIVWACRLQGTPVPERVAGSDLVWSLAGSAAQTGASLFLLGGNPGVAMRAADALVGRWPDLCIAGTYCPPPGFEHDPMERARIDASLENARPDIAYVALGSPKTERLIAELRARFPQTWFMGVGISLSFITGEVRRAPRWMQVIGLEWTHRLIQEPRRLFTRYVVHDAPFALRLLGHALAVRARNGREHTRKERGSA
jgi:N-acetylglucosaminyldiphosphoundecaprenol N-acetyl-beta-D-mannosaminyltransferase